MAASLGYQSIACEISPLNSLYLSQSITANKFQSLITLQKVALTNFNEGKELCTIQQVKGDQDNVGNTQWKGNAELATTSQYSLPSTCPPHFIVPIKTLDVILPVDINIGVMKADCEGEHRIETKLKLMLLLYRFFPSYVRICFCNGICYLH